MPRRGSTGATWRPDDARPSGIARYRTMWQLFRAEQTEPEPFYRFLAAEAVSDLARRHGPLDGQRLADLGCGPGWYSEALRDEGATVMSVDGDLDELRRGGRAVGGLHGDAGQLPVADATFDGVFCSNLLEHTPDTAKVIGEMARVLRPGGWGYLSWTNWYSPWGGHDMSPYHYLGPECGPRLYERRHGPPRKNRYGEGLFAVHIGPTLRLMEAEDRIAIDRVEPRYWPWARPIVDIPGLRELITWNCVVRFTRR
ncbi:MAG: class I SAM-dependent methyltransferase [Acidimicrobiia bacterium]|nr:class I SAM-dependent methyltransferase [Acidimicrobiia bacterium]